MFKKFLKSSIVISFFLLIPSNLISSAEYNRNKNISIENLLNKKNINFYDISDIVTTNNLELKSLKELVNAASYNLSSKISKRYPNLDLNANGLPQYLYGKNYNNNSIDTKTSQFKLNPSLNIRWDLIDPQRVYEIKLARNNYEVAQNNYEIKRKDLIQEARARYHKFQKSYADSNNAKIAVELSNISLKDAQSKLDAGIGTKFEVLEAEAQLAKDIQFLEEKKISQEIHKISLKEILNFKFEEDLNINNEQKLLGFWNHSLDRNIDNGLKNSFSLKNINLQRLIKKNQSKVFESANQPVIYISNSISSSFTRGSALQATIDPDASGSSYLNTLSLNLSWNFYKGGQNKNSYNAKKSEGASEKYKFFNLENIIKKNITESYLNLIKNEKKLISSKKEILASNESLRLTRLRYEVGISTLKDILIRQQELTRARTKKINAIYNYNLELDKLERLTFLEKNKECLQKDNYKKSQIELFCNY